MKTKSSRKKFALLALLAVALIVVGVTVWPPAKPARAANWPVEMMLQWVGNARNVNATAQLFAVGGIPIGDPFLLVPNQAYSDWTGSISDQGVTPSYVVFTWDYFPNGADLEYHWEYRVNGNPANPPRQAAAITSGTILDLERIQD